MINQQNGSSLIEVLVSVALSSIAALGLSMSTTIGYKLVHRSTQQALAYNVAASRIEQIKLSSPAWSNVVDTWEPLVIGQFPFVRHTKMDAYGGSALTSITARVSVYPGTEVNRTSPGAPLSSLQTTIIPWKKR